jgi:hypothetical protein
LLFASMRTHRVFRLIAPSLIAVLAISWLCLYLDSVYERRRAEHLVADLKSFPFSTAGCRRYARSAIDTTVLRCNHFHSQNFSRPVRR